MCFDFIITATQLYEMLTQSIMLYVDVIQLEPGTVILYC